MYNSTGWPIKSKQQKFKTSSNVDRFSQFFHWHTRKQICNKMIIKNPITPQTPSHTNTTVSKKISQLFPTFSQTVGNF